MTRMVRALVLSLVLACVLLWIWQLRGTHPDRQPSEPDAAVLQVLKPVAAPEPEFELPPIIRVEHGADSVPVPAPDGGSGEGIRERCWRTGPLDDRDIQVGLKQFAAPEFNARLIQEGRRDKVADWVYLPPLATLAAAREERRRLADLGVQDLAVVTTGPMRNGLSLGLFAEPGGALRRVAELKALGVTARIEPRYRDLERNFMVVRSTTVPDAEHSWRPVACE